MTDFFSKSFFRANRKRLLQGLPEDMPVVLTAAGLLQRNADNTYPYRQDSSFWYLTGVTDPDIVLVIDGAREYFIVPDRDYFREAFDGAISAEQLSQTSGVKTVLSSEEGWSKLDARLKGSKKVATFGAPPAYAEWHGFYSNPARASLIAKLQGFNPNLELVDLREHLASLRTIKQPAEIKAIRSAIDVTIEAIEYVTAKDRFAEYEFEGQIDADLSVIYRRHNCDEAFRSIVASGKHTCQLHYMANNDSLQAGDLVLFDVGAEQSMYAADIARTMPITKMSKRQQAVFDAVSEAQDFAFGLLKPGQNYKDYETAVEQFIGKKLQALGVITGNDSADIRRYFPHRVSHFLGLDAHDAGDYELPMAAGMVFAVEPGIYIPEEGIGVRIEDDVLITKTGHEVLTKRLPRLLR